MKTNDLSHELRELVTAIVRGLGLLEKSEASCCGMTLSQCHAIVSIGRSGEISLNELAGILNLDNSTMSRTVNNLVEQGLAERETDSSDRRYLKIKLTGDGQKTFEGVECNMESYFEQIMNNIPQNKQAQVLESLRLLTEAVKHCKCC